MDDHKPEVVLATEPPSERSWWLPPVVAIAIAVFSMFAVMYGNRPTTPPMAEAPQSTPAATRPPG